MQVEIARAENLARELLAKDLPRRWLHVAGVALRALETAGYLGLSSESLVAAAWLHDIGYAECAVETGFHPLDGARFLRSRGVADEVCGLVAYHSFAEVEADLRGLGCRLRREFDRPARDLSDALCYCDMSSGPTGKRISVDERLAEIRSRYGPDHLVTRFIDCTEDDLIESVQRVERKILTKVD